MKNILLILAIILGFSLSASKVRAEGSSWWQVQSIDIMKYSRDMSGQIGDTPSKFQTLIDFQVKAVADTGATHIGIATPYDERFIPVLRLWVQSARKHNLKVWFRGNFSGWEEWFGFSRISRDAHKQMLASFLSAHSELFEDGDLFSSCPECENGGPGDPRRTGDIDGHKAFLIEEYIIAKDGFYHMGKNVIPNLMSMNGDVARLIMDPETTQKLGGYVVIDHYVKTPEKMIADIRAIAEQSKGKIILGEMGAPIPDIHGNMSEQEQERWLDQTLTALALEKSVIGLNYWVGFGGSTQLWNDGGSPRLAVSTLRRFFVPPAASGIIRGRDTTPLSGVTVKTPWRVVLTKADGSFVLPLADGDTQISVFAPGYHAQNIIVSALGVKDLDIRLEKEQYSLFDRIKILIYQVFG